MNRRSLALLDGFARVRARSPLLGRLLSLPGRSLFPLVALALIAVTALWGPWVTLVLVAAWWSIVVRIA
jgi:hypothetical protein